MNRSSITLGGFFRWVIDQFISWKNQAIFHETTDRRQCDSFAAPAFGVMRATR